ncbi:MAG: PAS domain-containing protein [Anaerolineae bacterium]|nr:PAS domain-containing protein [Anaerolineae bacterium]
MIAEHELYSYIFRNTAEGILITDGQDRLEQVNPAASAMLVLPVESMIGKPPNECFYNNPALLNLFTRSGEQILDVRLPKRRLAVGLATSLQDGGRLVILRDVTEQRELESRREALIKTLTHDLRNPIGALIGYADLIDKFGPLTESQQRFTGRILETATKLHDITESLVDLAWLEAGMPMEHVPIELSQTVARVVSELTPLAHEKQVTIAVSLQKPLPAILGDPPRLYMAIHHLLHNAILYSSPEQSVAIHAWGDVHDIYCSIADQGFGIADDELDQVFDRMYRSKDERVQQIAGGGLGLTITRTIIKRHGGDIWAASNLNEGSTFTFVLPMVNQEN